MPANRRTYLTDYRLNQDCRGLTEETGDLGHGRRTFACFWIASRSFLARCFSVSFSSRFTLAFSARRLTSKSFSFSRGFHSGFHFKKRRRYELPRSISRRNSLALGDSGSRSNAEIRCLYLASILSRSRVALCARLSRAS